MKFEYLEVRPCIEIKGEIVSYNDEEQFTQELDRLNAVRRKRRVSFKSFWTVYGRHHDNKSGLFLAAAIGDFPTKEHAHLIMNAILAPMAHARDTLDAGDRFNAGENLLRMRIHEASDTLDDFINQSSNMERI